MLRTSCRAISRPKKPLASNRLRVQLSKTKQASVSHLISKKCVSTQKIPFESRHDRLAAQRLNRPTSPNLGIYKWTYVSSASALHRITGLLLSGSLYAFGTLYLVSPVLGLNVDSTTLAESFGTLPAVAKIGLKFGITMPFTYHAFNGVKHLIWDTGSLLGKKHSARATWVVLVCSVSASMALALYKFEEKPVSQ